MRSRTAGERHAENWGHEIPRVFEHLPIRLRLNCLLLVLVRNAHTRDHSHAGFARKQRSPVHQPFCEPSGLKFLPPHFL